MDTEELALALGKRANRFGALFFGWLRRIIEGRESVEIEFLLTVRLVDEISIKIIYPVCARIALEKVPVPDKPVLLSSAWVLNFSR